MTRWINPPPVEIPASFADLNLPPLIAQTLVRRGITEVQAARAFLQPDVLPSTPFPGIEKAVDVINGFIDNSDITSESSGVPTRKEQMICVWGDFDVDGQTSTALLVQTLQALGANVTYYIPIRGKEGHGIHIESLKPIIDNGAKLIITCDTGITAYEAIEYANSRGVDVVVTDHHELGETLPNARQSSTQNYCLRITFLQTLRAWVLPTNWQKHCYTARGQRLNSAYQRIPYLI